MVNYEHNYQRFYGGLYYESKMKNQCIVSILHPAFSITACQKKRTAKEVMQSSLKQSSSLKDADFNGNASIQLKREKRDLNQQLILR